MSLLKKSVKFSPINTIIFGFIVLILVGGFLISRPIFNNREISAIDSYFIATSAICVTGHSTVNIVEQFNIGGHIVILILMEIGGLGFVTLIAVIFLVLRKKILLKERILIGQTLSRENLSGMVKLIKKIVMYTICIQIVATIILSFIFVPYYGLGKGIFNSLFCSVSSFCNAGFDITNIGGTHIFQQSVIFNIVIMVLTIFGGVGFIVWDDIDEKIKYGIKNRFKIKKIITSFEVYTKLVLVMTIILIFVGAIMIYILEFNNVNTIGTLSIKNKCLTSIFHSVTARSTGITTINIQKFNDATKLVIIVLMFIGGASGSTAGGIKVATVAILALTMKTVIYEKRRVTVYGREISGEVVKKAITVFLMYLLIMLIFVMLISVAVPNLGILDICIEVVSSLGTVGISTGIVSTFGVSGKLMIMMLMYVGRVGTITMAFAFVSKRNKISEVIRYPEEKIVIG